MTLRATEQSSRTRAKACMDVIKNGLKEEHLNPKAMVNGLEDAERLTQWGVDYITTNIIE